METKEIKINIPEGYEIDEENSTFECIKFKPSTNNISNFNYQNVCDNLLKEKHGYYIDSSGVIRKGLLKVRSGDLNNAPSRKQLEKLLALNQLLNITYYCNNCKYVEKGYMIVYNKEQEYYEVIESGNNYYKLTTIDPIFEKTEDAQAVIDNPNFRDILDTLCK